VAFLTDYSTNGAQSQRPVSPLLLRFEGRKKVFLLGNERTRDTMPEETTNSLEEQ
jgi:hypothetical protein